MNTETLNKAISLKNSIDLLKKERDVWNNNYSSHVIIHNNAIGRSDAISKEIYTVLSDSVLEYTSNKIQELTKELENL